MDLHHLSTTGLQNGENCQPVSPELLAVFNDNSSSVADYNNTTAIGGVVHSGDLLDQNARTGTTSSTFADLI